MTHTQQFRTPLRLFGSLGEFAVICENLLQFVQRHLPPIGVLLSRQFQTWGRQRSGQSARCGDRRFKNVGNRSRPKDRVEFEPTPNAIRSTRDVLAALLVQALLIRPPEFGTCAP